MMRAKSPASVNIMYILVHRESQVEQIFVFKENLERQIYICFVKISFSCISSRILKIHDKKIFLNEDVERA